MTTVLITLPKAEGGACPCGIIKFYTRERGRHDFTMNMRITKSPDSHLDLQHYNINTMSTEDESQEPLLEWLSPTPEPDSTPNSKKRKRGVVEQGAKKAAKKTKSKKTTDDDGLDVDAGINNAFSHMDNQLLADYIAQRTKKYESDLSSIELEDKYIPGRLGHIRLWA